MRDLLNKYGPSTPDEEEIFKENCEDIRDHLIDKGVDLREDDELGIMAINDDGTYTFPVFHSDGTDEMVTVDQKDVDSTFDDQEEE